MEVSIRMMLVLVMGLIVVLVAIMIVTSLTGSASGGISDFFRWILGSLGPAQGNP
jgi:Flp pilus assembly pilin Flp